MTVPHDPDAERAFVGALLLSPSQMDAVTQRIQPSDLYLHDLRDLFTAMIELRDSGIAIDGVTLRSHLITGPSDADLRALQHAAPVSGHAGAYAGIIAEHAARRRLLAAAERIRAAAADLDVPMPDAQGIAHDALRWVDLPVDAGDPSPTIDDLADMEVAHDWVVRGLIERLDRILVVAGEGHGKSLLLAQLAVQLAAGIHPWEYQAIEPARTLIVDLENPPRILARRMHRLRDAANERVGAMGWDTSRCRIESRPQGLDVTQRADEQWLMGRVAAARPDVLLIGPLYKLHEVEEEKSAAVRQVQKVLDLIRTRYRCAVVMETHAPHESFAKEGRLRPAGSRLWIRWPEWVLALAPQSRERLDGIWRLEHVRPGREQRTWPAKVRRGQAWPWERAEL